MKSLFFLTMFLVHFGAHADKFTPNFKLVPHLPELVFIPVGFDNNDLSQLVIEGIYSDTCHKSGTHELSVDSENKKIFITNNAILYDQSLCSPISTKFVKTIDLGILDTGNYSVLFKSENGSFVERGVLPVKKAEKNTLDDFIYAPVEKAIFENEPTPSVKLRGSFSNSCLSMDKVQVIPQAEQKVVVILPIAKLSSENCHELEQPADFTESVDLSGLAKGKYLLHIRSLNGQATNEVVNIK